MAHIGIRGSKEMEINDIERIIWNMDPVIDIQRLALGRNTENWHKTGP